MRRWPSADTPRVPRVVRALWPDRNPLRRTLDRVEAAVVYGLVVAFLAAAPLAALIAGRFAYSVGSRAVHAQQAAWHRVPAVLLTAVPTAGDGFYEATAPASWKAPDGTRLDRHDPVPSGTPRVGHTVTVGSMRLAGADPGRRCGFRRCATRRRSRPCSPPLSSASSSRARPAGPGRAGLAAAGRLGRGLAGNRAAMDQAA